MDILEPYVLIPYLEWEEVSNLRLLNWHWCDWIDRNLSTLAYCYNLPVFTNFAELHQSYFWSANRLLDYAVRTCDERVKTIALNRYAVVGVPQEPFNRRNIESLPVLKNCLQRDRKVRKYRLSEFCRTFIYWRNYELAIYIIQTYKSKQDLWHKNEFREFCLNRNLFDVLRCLVRPRFALYLMEQTGCTEEEAADALIETDNNCGDALTLLTSEQ